MKSINYIFLFSLIGLIGCSSPSSENIEYFVLKDFSKRIELTGLALPLVDVKKPYNIKVIPEYDIMILLEAAPSEYWGRVYNLSSMALLKKLWKYGSADGEFIVANNLRYDRGAKFISVTDPVKQIIYNFSLDSICLSGPDVKPSNIFYLKEFKQSLNTVHRPLILDSNILDIRNYHPDSATAIVNVYSMTGKYIHSFGDYPSTLGSYEKKELSQVFAAGLNKSEDNKHVILDYFNTDLLEIRRKDGELVKRLLGPQGYPPDFHKRKLGKEFMSIPSGTSHFGYTGIPKFSNDSILVLFNGALQKSSKYHTHSLFSFTNKLRPAILYTLKSPVFDFDIIPAKRKIYGLSHEPIPQVIVFAY